MVTRSILSWCTTMVLTGVSSEPNEQFAQDLGVKHVILPKRGYRSKERLKHEHKAWFVKGRHWHAGVAVWLMG